MCAVSAVTDHYREKWFTGVTHDFVIAPPESVAFDGIAGWQTQTYTLKPGITITQEQWAEYQELKRRMEAYDAKTHQPDCVKPEVAMWEKVAEAAVQQ